MGEFLEILHRERKDTVGACGLNLYLHEGCQVGVVVVQGGDDVELYFNCDALTQVVLSSDGCQSVKQLDLGSSVGERREE